MARFTTIPLTLSLLAAAGLGTARAQSSARSPRVSTSGQRVIPPIYQPAPYPGRAVLRGVTGSVRGAPGTPQVFAPTKPRQVYIRYPWKRKIGTTVFWVGERPTARNPTPNHASSWDQKWAKNYGGYDNPDPSTRIMNGYDYRPKAFYPKQNPFYIALPYNDVSRGKTKPEARYIIPWFKQRFWKEGRSVVKSRWLAIRRGNRLCYAQWEDCGPFTTTDWHYVFGKSPQPKNRENGRAGLDVAPAVRDYLGMKSGDKLDWRFVELYEIPYGPWCRYGDNNHFVIARRRMQARAAKAKTPPASKAPGKG